MTTLLSTARIEIATSPLSIKERHLLRKRLEEAFEEAAEGVFAELGINNQFARTVSVDEIEVEIDHGPGDFHD